MDKLEVFNRQSGTWDSNFTLITGWSENFVTDKTTDNGKIKLKYKGLEYPNWENGDWCRFIHTDDGSVSYTKGQYGLASEFVVESLIIERTFIATGNQITGFTFTFSLENAQGQPITYGEQITIDFIFHIMQSSTELQASPYTIIIPAGQSSVTRTIEMEIGDGSVATTAYSNSSIEITDITPMKAHIAGNYIDYYLPKDHAQYLIANLSMAKDKVNNEIDIQFDLIEPIEYLKGINIETRSLSNQISKKVDDATYMHEKLTYLNVLEMILKTTRANNDLNKSWWSRIKIADAEMLNAKQFNDVTYSEQTLYSILMDKFDASLGMTPVLYFDIDAQTDLPYNLDRPEYVLKFERQDGADKQSITLDILREGSNQELLSKSLDNFTEGLIMNYDNLASNVQSKILSNGIFAIPEVDTDQRVLTGFTQQDGEWVVKTPHKIKQVNKVVKYLISYRIDVTYQTQVADVSLKEIDSKYIMNDQQYKASEYYDSQNNDHWRAIWYVEGENKIHINDVQYYPLLNGSSRVWAYYIEYDALIDGRIETGGDYLTPVNQMDGQIDAYAMGKYLQNYLQSMNKADITISKTISNYAEIYSRGTRVYDNGKMYLITNVSVQNRNQDYEVVYQLNENHFRKNDSIEAPQEVRKNIEIGVDATKERKSCLIDKYYIGFGQQNKYEHIFNQDQTLMFVSPLLNTANCPKIAKLIFKSVLYGQITMVYTDDLYYWSRFEVSTEDFTKELACDLAKFYSANTIWFNMRYFDNAEAGKKKELQYYSYGYYGDVYGVPDTQVPILYTDYFGEIEKFDIFFAGINGADLLKDTKPITTLSLREMENEGINSHIKNSAKYPEPLIVGQEYFNVENINYYKQRLETFNYSIGVRFETDRKITLCEDFFKLNNLMQEEDMSADRIRVYNKNISEEDYLTAIPEAEVNITSKSTTALANGYDIEYTLQSNITSPKCVVFVSKIGTPLLIIQDYDMVRTGDFNTLKLFCQ